MKNSSKKNKLRSDYVETYYIIGITGKSEKNIRSINNLLKTH